MQDAPVDAAGDKQNYRKTFDGKLICLLSQGHFENICTSFSSIREVSARNFGGKLPQDRTYSVKAIEISLRNRF